jgi:hypothetical protein
MTRRKRDPWHPSTEPSGVLNPLHPAPGTPDKELKEFWGPEDPEADRASEERGKEILKKREEDACKRKANGRNPRY